MHQKDCVQRPDDTTTLDELTHVRQAYAYGWTQVNFTCMLESEEEYAPTGLDENWQSWAPALLSTFMLPTEVIC